MTADGQQMENGRTNGGRCDGPHTSARAPPAPRVIIIDGRKAFFIFNHIITYTL